MTEFSSPHPPGTFCWAELATTDQNAGIAFYRALFGWDVHPGADWPRRGVFDVPDARQGGRGRV